MNRLYFGDNISGGYPQFSGKVGLPFKCGMLILAGNLEMAFGA